MKKQFKRQLLGAIFVAFATLASACGGNTTTSQDTQAPSPATVARIVSLSPTHTEIMYAIGAADQIVAVDSLSTYPPETARVLTDLSAYEPNVEAISAYKPDLVVISGDFTGLTEQLKAIGIAVWSGQAVATLDEVYAQIDELGVLLGHSEQAAELVLSMQSGIEKIIADAPVASKPMTYYHELDDTYYSATSNTFIGSLYSLFDLGNIADATKTDSDYPQLSAEFIVSQNPDFIFLADTKCCAVTVDTVAARPGWNALAAVLNNNVISMDDDIASRWGPRVVDYVQAIAAALQAAMVPAG